jgi:GT2 family glycosyltransferase
MPGKVLDVELSKEIRPIYNIEGDALLYILVRYQGRPVGWVSITDLRQLLVPATLLRKVVAEQLGWELVPIVLGEQLTRKVNDGAPTIPVSVVVCTRDRAEQLECCLKALLALEYAHYEIIVVDNAPKDDATARLVSDLPVRYVCETRPGLNWARNRGIAEARHSIIAFTDDDACPDRLWLQAIVRAFVESEVMAVTGLVAPAELETTAQIFFEFGYGGMGHGFRRRTVRRNALTDGELLWASAFGVGANMAFRRELFDIIGPFDVALDVGTPSGGGGDIEMFHRLVAHGYTLVYEPAALVWHTHRRYFASLRRQLYDNGRSFGAYLLTCMHNRTVGRLAILRFMVWEWVGGWILRRLLHPRRFPRHLIWIELFGAFVSPLAYRAAQRHARQTCASFSLSKPMNYNL